jgi:hypothetical protein
VKLGLDVYVGTLTRYYAHDWESVVQRAAREMGLALQIDCADASETPAEPTEIEPLILAWRDGLNASLAAHVPSPVVWREGMAPPYFTDKPAWDCYSALLVWAAHEEHAGLPLPTIAPEDWTTDLAVRRSQAEGFTSRYGQLLYGPELWLPCDFAFTFRAPDPTETEVVLGSTRALARQLDELNNRTWNASADSLSKWRLDGADHGAPLERSARFGFAVFDALVRAANDEQLPLKLDY